MAVTLILNWNAAMFKKGVGVLPQQHMHNLSESLAQAIFLIRMCIISRTLCSSFHASILATYFFQSYHWKLVLRSNPDRMSHAWIELVQRMVWLVSLFFPKLRVVQRSLISDVVFINQNLFNLAGNWIVICNAVQYYLQLPRSWFSFGSFSRTVSQHLSIAVGAILLRLPSGSDSKGKQGSAVVYMDCEEFCPSTKLWSKW